MKIQCHIERSGPTTVMYAGVRFDFVENEHGHYVCDVPNPGAASYFIETLTGKFYSKYVEPEVILDLKPTGLVDKYDAMTTKEEIVDACLADFGVTLNKKFSIANLKEQVMAASLQGVEPVIEPVVGIVVETLINDAAVDHSGDAGE